MTYFPGFGFANRKPETPYNVDTRVNNCANWLPAPNCDFNPHYDMPNAFPSTWGPNALGLTLANPGGWGSPTTFTDEGLTNVNARNYSYTYGPVILGPNVESHRSFNNCNCNGIYGTGIYNCYTNCDCGGNCGGDCMGDCGK